MVKKGYERKERDFNFKTQIETLRLRNTVTYWAHYAAFKFKLGFHRLDKRMSYLDGYNWSHANIEFYEHNNAFGWHVQYDEEGY